MPRIVTETDRATMRRQIIQAAAEEFSLVGFDQARMETISERVGVGKGTIYLYFKSKEVLFSEMLEEIAQEQLAELAIALQNKTTLRDRLTALLTTFNHLASEHPESFRIFISSLYGVNRRFKEAAAKQAQNFLRLVEIIIEDSQKRGEIQQEVEPAALIILNTCQFILLQAQTLGFEQEYIDSKCEQVIDMLVAGLSKP